MAKGDTTKLSTAIETVHRRLKSHTYLRTNHFEVEQELGGLDERFRVNHRDSLADALRQRLQALKKTSSSWDSEILHLFLRVSDQPTFKADLGDVESLRPEQEAQVKSLRWEDIAKEDGWERDPQLWRPIRYHDESDDEVSDVLSEGESEATSLFGESQPVARLAESYVVVSSDQAALDEVRTAQQWRDKAPSEDSLGHVRKVAVPEVLVVRDMLFMLQGLETTLFDKTCAPLPSFQLAGMEWETYRAMVQTFTDWGQRLQTLRLFAGERLDVPHRQAFQDCIALRLSAFDANLSGLQRNLAAPEHEVCLSLVKIKTDLQSLIEPLYLLATIVARIDTDHKTTPFRYLELLFDETCLSQLNGKPELCEFLGRIFAECFRVYLRPIRLWMDEGKLLSASDLFFVAETSGDTPLGRTWHDRYRLRQTSDGTLHAPAFLRTAAGNIYRAGKNIVLLKLLGRYDSVPTARRMEEPSLDYEAICPPGHELVPFSELFDAAFDRWIQSKYRPTSMTLKNVLVEDWALLPTLDVLQKIYLMSDGSLAAVFLDKLFTNLDEERRDWASKTVLSAATQESFGSIVEPGRLAISAAAKVQRMPVAVARASVKSALAGIHVQYRLKWPLQMILTDDTMAYYQATYTLLLQLQRATHSLRDHKLLEDYTAGREVLLRSNAMYMIRNKLVWFCNSLQSYLTTLVLSPLEDDMRRGLMAAQDMDAMIHVVEKTLQAMLDLACLGESLVTARQYILELLDLALGIGQIQRPNSATFDGESLQKAAARFDQLVRFIRDELRNAARATTAAHAAKWDILADMLQTQDDD